MHIAQHLGWLTVYLGNETTTVVIPLVRSVFLASSEFLGLQNGALNVSGAGGAYIDEVVKCVIKPANPLMLNLRHSFTRLLSESSLSYDQVGLIIQTHAYVP